jgi:uncharacterized protein (DUF2384 family)
MTDTARIDAVLSTLAASKEHEHALLEELDALLQTSDLPVQVVRVVAQAREVLDEDAVRWLATPHWSLDRQMPLRIAQDLRDAARVEDLLTRIASGLPV